MPSFIVLEMYLPDKFCAAKKDRNSAINEPIIVVSAAKAIVTARLNKI